MGYIGKYFLYFKCLKLETLIKNIKVISCSKGVFDSFFKQLISKFLQITQTWKLIIYSSFNVGKQLVVEKHFDTTYMTFSLTIDPFEEKLVKH